MTGSDIPRWVSAHAEGLRQRLSRRSADVAGFEWSVLKSGPETWVLKLETPGARAIAKVFRQKGSEAQAAFEREVSVLTAARGTGLAPEPIGFDKRARYVVMEHIEGRTLGSLLAEADAVELARRAGAWFGAYCGHMHSVETTGTWLDYLSRYSEFRMGKSLVDQSAWLGGLAVGRMAVAKNDAYTANFIIRPDGRFVGIDFESARLKPVGWDILLTARSLARDVPRDADAAIEALVAGWGQGTEAMDQDAFLELARFFAEKTKGLE